MHIKMFELDITNACRICLDHGAIYPIFERQEDFKTVKTVHDKLAQCIKIEDIAGYPRNICLKCRNTLDTIYSFIKKFEESNEILQSKVATVKTENFDLFETFDHDYDDFKYELQIGRTFSIEPKVEKRDYTEILDSLTHVTVKRIKLGNDSESNINNSENKKKQSRLKKSPMKNENVPKKPKNVSNSGPKNNSINRTRKQPIKGSPNGSTTKSVKKIAVRTEKKKENLNDPGLCDLCGVIFSTYRSLCWHKKSEHKIKRFVCPKCPDKAYEKKDSLSQHILSHEKIRNFICDICRRGFYKRKVLIDHLAFVHEKNGKRQRKNHFKCKYCDKTYTHHRGVTVHERSVHTGERPAVCTVCSKSFYDQVYLTEHMRIHTGNFKYKCPVCGRGCTQLSNMKSHLRIHRISELDPETRSRIKPNYFKLMKP